jgi:hypothetical protein
MNPMHREVGRSAGLHLFQELTTLGQQLAHTLLFRQGLGGVKPMVSSEHAATARARVCSLVPRMVFNDRPTYKDRHAQLIMARRADLHQRPNTFAQTSLLALPFSLAVVRRTIHSRY